MARQSRKEGPPRQRQSPRGEPEWRALSMLAHVRHHGREEQRGDGTEEAGGADHTATLKPSDRVPSAVGSSGTGDKQ